MSQEAAADPIGELSHDHGELTALVMSLKIALSRVSSGDATLEDAREELREGAAALRETLLTHFAREEEALFPFVLEQLGRMRERADGLRVDHDAVCAAATVLVNEAERQSLDAQACTNAVERFERVYVDHSRRELAFLSDVGALLDVHSREELRRLLASI